LWQNLKPNFDLANAKRQKELTDDTLPVNSTFLYHIAPKVFSYNLNDASDLLRNIQNRYLISCLKPNTNTLKQTEQSFTMSAAAPANFDPEQADNLEDVKAPVPYVPSICQFSLLTSLQIEKQFAVKGSHSPNSRTRLLPRH
jgi:hypothetical protein